MHNWLTFVETLFVALAGAVLFSLIHIPIPWLIGPLIAVALWHIAMQRDLFWPASFQKIAMVLLGYLTGTSFTEQTLIEMGHHIPSMIAVTLSMIAFSLLLGWLFSLVTGLDLSSCMIGSIPGGLSQIMVLLNEIKGLNPTVIMFLQSMRMMTIVILVPMAAVYLFGGDSGAAATGTHVETASWLSLPWYSYITYPVLILASIWLLTHLHIPAAMLLAPLIVAIGLTLTGLPAPELPGSIVKTAQLFIGVHIGLQMNPRDLPGWKYILVYASLMIVLLVLFGFGLGAGLAVMYDVPYTTALLSTTPGGMVEMGLTAAGIGADISVVTSYQLFRLLLIMVWVPFFFKWLESRHA